MTDKPFAILEEWVRQGRIHLSQPPLLPMVAAQEAGLPDLSVGPLPEGLREGINQWH